MRAEKKPKPDKIPAPASEWDILKGHKKMAACVGVELRTFQRWLKRGLVIPGNPRPICTRGELMRAIRAMKNGK